jgi:CMP-N-acetylneuraminic acid synthetase
MTTLALIPARGGSKGVTRKNLRLVGGRSLLARAIDAARDSRMVDCVVVSTDDEEIAAAARCCGVEVPFLRPAELASDQSAIEPAIAHAVENFERISGATVRTLVLIEPTSPFRNAGHVRAALERFQAGDCRSVISVCPLERKPENIFAKSDGVVERYIRDAVPYVRRQDMGQLCRLNSAVYVVGRDKFMETSRLIVEPVGFIEMSALESINIDEELDLVIAEVVAGRFGL